MRALILVQAVLTILSVIAFFALVYVTYICTYLAPTQNLRRWGTTTSWRLIQFGAPCQAKVVRIDRRFRPPSSSLDYGFTIARCGALWTCDERTSLWWSKSQRKVQEAESTGRALNDKLAQVPEGETADLAEEHYRLSEPY